MRHQSKRVVAMLARRQRTDSAAGAIVRINAEAEARKADRAAVAHMGPRQALAVVTERRRQRGVKHDRDTVLAWLGGYAQRSILGTHVSIKQGRTKPLGREHLA